MKISEAFEGENSSLRKTFDEVVTPQAEDWRERLRKKAFKSHDLNIYPDALDLEGTIDFIESLLLTQREQIRIDENTSDGYHTFKELYEFRLLYNAALFNEWAKQGLYNVHKSQRHNDGELCFGREDYFIVVATLPNGQISNHYPMSDWDLFKCEVVEKAKAMWDGHTSQDVASRLRALLAPNQE